MGCGCWLLSGYPYFVWAVVFESDGVSQLREFSSWEICKRVPDSMAQSYLSYSAHSVENNFWLKLFIKVNDKSI